MTKWRHQLWCLFCYLGLLPTLSAEPTLQFVATPAPTLVSEPSQPARINSLVTNLFAQMQIHLLLHVERRAFADSGLLSGKYQGNYAFIDLNEKDTSFLYSDSYLPLQLYLVSKNKDVSHFTVLSELDDVRVGILNIHATNPIIRSHSEVKWSRSPAVADLFKLLGDRRAEFALVDGLTLIEINQLLLDNNKEPLFYTTQPMLTAGYRIALSKNVPNAQSIILKLNSVIEKFEEKQIYQEFLSLSLENVTSNDVEQRTDIMKFSPKNNRNSLLNSAVFSRILKRW